MKKLIIVVASCLFIFCFIVQAYGVGDQIVFSRELAGNWDVWTYNLTNQSLQQITSTTGDEINPVWLNRGIAYIRNRNIFLYRAGEEKQLTNEGKYRYLSYDQQKNRLLYSFYFQFEKANLGFYDLDTQEQGIIFKSNNQQQHPVISEDKEVVYYVNGRVVGQDIKQSIYMYTSQGNRQPLFKAGTRSFYRPAVSSGGEKLAFVINGSQGIKLGIANPTEGEITTTINQYDYYDYPVWSPKAEKLLYTAVVKGSLKLCVYDLETAESEIINIKGRCKDGDWK